MTNNPTPSVRNDVSEEADPSTLAASEATQAYLGLLETFWERAQGMWDCLGKYWWYHTVDLGNGLVTPGCYDYRQSLSSFKFPPDMRGMRVLDVGSATGFFAFEFEQRGADVTSVEVPSLSSLDCFPGDTLQDQLRKARIGLGNLGWMPIGESVDHLFANSTPEEIYRNILDGPFKFCHETLGSKVVRHYGRVYDLPKANLGPGGFDLVFAGDVLLHTINPLQALAALKEVCSGMLIIAQPMPELPEPGMRYIGGGTAGEDGFAWWLADRVCLEQLLKKLGFKHVEVIGEYSGFMRPVGLPYKRTIVHAYRG